MFSINVKDNFRRRPRPQTSIMILRVKFVKHKVMKAIMQKSLHEYFWTSLSAFILSISCCSFSILSTFLIICLTSFLSFLLSFPFCFSNSENGGEGLLSLCTVLINGTLQSDFLEIFSSVSIGIWVSGTFISSFIACISSSLSCTFCWSHLIWLSILFNLFL